VWPQREKAVFFVLYQLVRNKAGVTAIEYGLIVALIAIAITTAMRAIGVDIKTTFTSLAGTL
jgi:pilus assembly protein Flp/PilA